MSTTDQHAVPDGAARPALLSRWQLPMAAIAVRVGSAV